MTEARRPRSAREGRTERETWKEVAAEQKSFLVEVLHWYHFRTPALRGSWGTEEALTWELIRALQLLPRPALAGPIVQRLLSLGGTAAAATEPLLRGEIGVGPFPSLGYVEGRPNCRSDIGLLSAGVPCVWLEAKTRSFSTSGLAAQLEEQRAALARLSPGQRTAVVPLLPARLAAPFRPCLTWSDILAALEEGLADLALLVPHAELRRGYELLGRELVARIRTHPNGIVG